MIPAAAHKIRLDMENKFLAQLEKAIEDGDLSKELEKDAQDCLRIMRSAGGVQKIGVEALVYLSLRIQMEGLLNE